MQALRQTIRDDIRNERWEAAGGLVNEIDRRFGCEEEAAQLREELAEARQEAIEAKLSEVIAMNHLLKYSGVDAAERFSDSQRRAMLPMTEYLEEDYE